jgi:hypothetical protein
MEPNASSCFMSYWFLPMGPILLEWCHPIHFMATRLANPYWISWLSLDEFKLLGPFPPQTKFWCQHMPSNFGIKWFYSKITSSHVLHPLIAHLDFILPDSLGFFHGSISSTSSQLRIDWRSWCFLSFDFLKPFSSSNSCFYNRSSDIP